MKLVLAFLVSLCCMDACACNSTQKKACMKSNITTYFNENIYEMALKNNFFRKEIITGPHSQVVVMSIPANGEIGSEVHRVDQTLIFVQGHGQAIINDQVSEVHPHHLVFVPAGTKHNFKNTGSQNLKLFTIYAPPQHKPGTVAKTKPEND